MLFNNLHPPLEISPTDQRVWKEHPITRAFVFPFRPIQNQTWIQRQTAGWGRSNSACLSSALAKSSWSSSLRRGGLITRLIRHHTFSSLSQTPASAQSCQMCRRGRRNKTPSRPITRLNRTRFSWHLFTTENFDYEKSTREIQEDWRTGFPFPLPEILFFDFFACAVWQSQITDPETDMKLKKKELQNETDHVREILQSRRQWETTEVMQHSSSGRVLQNSSSLKCKKKKEGL